MNDYLYRLLLLSGPLCGREIELRDGVFTIGGDDADLALPLDAGATCRLEVAADGVRLLDDVPCWLDGQPWQAAGVLPPGRVLDVAGLLLMLGPAGAAVPVPAVLPRRQTPTRRGRLPFVLAGGLALLLALAGWGLGQTRAPEAGFDAARVVEARLREPALAQVRARWTPGGVLTLSGRCLDSARLAGLRDTLTRNGVWLRDEVVCRDELLARVGRLLALHGYREARVDAGTTLDSVDIRGDIRFDARWEALTRQLDALPGLAAWSVGNDGAGVLAELAAALAREKLLDGVVASRQGQRVLVGALLPPERQQALAGALDRFAQAGGRRLDIRLQAIPPAREAAALLPAPVAAVGGDPAAPYLELANGTRLLPGGQLPGGYRILALGRHGVSLLGDSALHYIPYDL